MLLQTGRMTLWRGALLWSPLVVELLRRESLEIDLKRAHKRPQYCAAILIEAVLFSTLLKSRSTAKEAASQSLLLACPPSVAKQLQERMEAAQRFPSKSSIQRASFMVDCAARLVHQTTFGREPCRLYGMADSSPQGGIDWLNSQFH